MLCVHGGPPPTRLTQAGSVTTLQLQRSALALHLEQDLAFDPLFARHLSLVGKALQNFGPEIIHITGPSEFGILGAWFAWRLRLPLAASWHTNVHEYANRRLAHTLRGFGPLGKQAARAAEAGALAATTRFYRLAKVLYAPNAQLCAMLAARTGRPCHLMQRGVDTELFTPARRNRSLEPTNPILGYVGRLSVEKNVALLPRIDRAVRTRGLRPRWTVVGHGAEEPALRHAFGKQAEFTGILRGEALAAAYANMDLLVFPSHTDTFGNVVLEALASGVPAVVTPDGGPAHIVQDGKTGRVVPDEGFPDAIADLLQLPEQQRSMATAARAYALGCSWDAVFERVLAAYPV